MTTPEDPRPLPTHDEVAVRRLLGSVDDPPLPPAVAARLDAQLADLVAQRAGAARADADEPAPVVPLAGRRRTVVRALFVAAVAAVIAGIGVPLLHQDDETPISASQGAADRASVPAPAASLPSGQERGHEHHVANGSTEGLMRRRDAPNSAQLGGLTGPDGRAASRISPRHLRGDLVRLQREVPAASSYGSSRVRAPAGFTCDRARFGRGYLLGVRYAGSPAVVAFRAPVGSSQVAEVLQCGTAEVLRSVTLPTR